MAISFAVWGHLGAIQKAFSSQLLSSSTIRQPMNLPLEYLLRTFAYHYNGGKCCRCKGRGMESREYWHDGADGYLS